MIIDVREHQSRIQQCQERFPKATIEQLDVGDYVDGNLAIEWKGDDFLPSVHSGRLFHQLDEIKKNYSIPVLMVAKSAFELREEMKRPDWPDPYAGFNGAIASCIVRGMVPLFIQEPTWGFDLMKKLSKKANDNKNRSLVSAIREHAIPTINIPSPPIPGFKDKLTKRAPTYADYQMNILMGFPRMSKVRAETIIREFRSLSNFFNTEPKEVKSRVKGVDKMADIWSSLVQFKISDEKESDDFEEW